MEKKNRTGASKGSRNKKRYWRKGTQLDDVEQHLDDLRQEERQSERLKNRKDANLFSVDKKKSDGLPTLTRRQRFALAKTLAPAPSADDVEVKPKIRKSFPSKKKTKPADIVKKEKGSRKGEIDTKPVEYDLWNTDLAPKAALRDDLADYYLRQTKRKMPNEPLSVKHITTLLPKVEVPMPGASYNPTYKDHQDLLRETLVDELKIQKDLEKVEKRFKLAPGDRYITPYEKMTEEMSGLVKAEEELIDEVDDDEKDADDEYKPELAPISSENRKLSAARKRELLDKKKQAARRNQKVQKKLLNDVFRAKTLQRQVEKEQKRVEMLAKQRAERKKIDKLTKPNRLSKAKFEAPEEPFLLTDDLVGSLRELKPAGDLLRERMKSFQKRNLLPAPGTKTKRKYKRKLHVKWTEKRSVQEVTVGSRVL